MSKRNKAAALALVILAMASALASCYWTGGEEKEAQGAKADGSTLSASFGGKAYDSFMELSDDGTLDESADITFTATHTLGGSEVRGALFDFEIDAEGVELTEWGTKGRQCSLRLSDLKWLGTYRITAKSRLGREFDRTITVLLTSPVQKLEVSYALTSDGTGGKLTDEMKSGSITGVKQKLTLAAGGTYSLKATVSPLGSARTLLCSSTDTQSAYFTSVSGSEAELALPGADGAVFEIRISLGRTNVLVSAEVTLSDISDAEIEDWSEQAARERTLSFAANTAEEPDRSYEYVLNVDGFSSGKEVLFSIDAEEGLADSDAPEDARHPYGKGDRLPLGSLELEQWLADSPHHRLRRNDSARWYRIMTLTGSMPDDSAETEPEGGWPARNKLSVTWNSATRRISIRPLADTVWDRRRRNAHHYIYFKYADDEEWRWRWRVTVGGVMEGISLYYMDPEDETRRIPLEDHVIGAGDRTSFYVRAAYEPFHSYQPSDEMLFYVSASDEETREYSVNGNRVRLPVPADADSATGKCMRINDADLVRDGTTLADIRTADGSPLSYYARKPMSSGECSLYLRYSDAGETCVLVALDWRTGKSKTFKLWKDDSSSTVTVRSVREAPNELLKYRNQKGKRFYSTKAVAADDRGTPCEADGTLDTGYAGTAGTADDPYAQKYPLTVQKGYERRRTFLIPYDEAVTIDVDANFEIESIQGDVSSAEAQAVLGKFQTGISSDPHSAQVTIASQWAIAKISDRDEMCRIDSCTSTYDGISIDLKINSDITVPLRLVLYYR